MSRILRVVPLSDWPLCDAIEHRHSRLLEVLMPDALLAEVCKHASDAAQTGRIHLCWQPSCECPEYFRVVAQVPLVEPVFDQFFNGRSGYRAHYYLSPEEGVLYNRDVLQGLRAPLSTAYSKVTLPVSLGQVLRSLDGPHSKVWVFEDRAAFDDAAENSLNPPRWVKNHAVRGRRAPLPSHLMLDIKGAFIHPTSGALFVDLLKVDRACDLFQKGYT